MITLGPRNFCGQSKHQMPQMAVAVISLELNVYPFEYGRCTVHRSLKYVIEEYVAKCRAVC